MATVRGFLKSRVRHLFSAVLVLLGVIGLFAHSMLLGGKLGTTAFSEADRGAVYLRLEFPTRYKLARWANTSPSSRELEASRLAP